MIGVIQRLSICLTWLPETQCMIRVEHGCGQTTKHLHHRQVGFSIAIINRRIIEHRITLPIRRNIDKKFGVLYLESIWLQFFGTAGNFWSYRTVEGAETYDFYGDPVAVNEDDVIRELPFSDRLEKCPQSVRDRNGGECGRALFPVATMNGNRMLFDAGVELRIRANLFNRSSWNSFIRVAYGFNEVGGIFDVDGDDIVTNVDDPNLNALSSEKERPSIRFYIGWRGAPSPTTGR